MRTTLIILLLLLMPVAALAAKTSWSQEEMIRQWQAEAALLPAEQRGSYLAERIAALVPGSRQSGRFCRVKK